MFWKGNNLSIFVLLWILMKSEFSAHGHVWDCEVLSTKPYTYKGLRYLLSCFKPVWHCQGSRASQSPSASVFIVFGNTGEMCAGISPGQCFLTNGHAEKIWQRLLNFWRPLGLLRLTADSERVFKGEQPVNTMRISMAFVTITWCPHSSFSGLALHLCLSTGAV